MAEWFQLLESNDQKQVDEAKRKFHEQFNHVKEAWLLNGLYDYYLSTNSVPSMEILINIREPHHSYLFDKLSDSIRGSKNDSKVQALTLFGHVVRKHPTWLHKITQHTLFKDVIKLLKNESDILPLLSALLVLIVLLPCIPASMSQFLFDVFEIFSRLAAWNCNNPGKLVEEQMVHMQVGLYALFQRLYGMYPCNFVTYLRNHYRNKDVSPIFTHTIKPMLQTVQMHPLLVTNSKDFETTTERWKKMEAHDVVMECERFSMGFKDRFSHDTCMPTAFRSRSGTTNSATFESPYQFLKIPPTPNLIYDCDFFSPSQMVFHSQTPPVNETSVATAIPLSSVQGAGQSLISSVAHQSQEGTSPPEAAIEATPETTPIKDIRMLSNRQHPPNTTVMRALNNFGTRSWSVGSSNTTPTHSQPSSPMRKDFPSENLHMSAFGLPKRESYAHQKLQKLIQDRSQVSEGMETILKCKPLMAPTSPLRIIPPTSSTDNSIPNSPLPSQRVDSPVSQEDEEVLAIVRQGELSKHPGLRQCDSVLHDVDGCRSNEDEIEDCEHGSPCTSGGLHMPNSKQMTVFRNNMKRLRYHSQCAPDGEQVDISTTGSSPGNSVPSNNLTVRRANSCPEMKKGTVVSAKDNFNKTLEENEEETNQEDKHMNGFELQDVKKERYKKLATSETQTENFWPMPYEHLFLSIFPSLENTDVKPSPAPSPAPYNLQHEKYTPTSFNDILDRYIDVACQSNEKETMKVLKDQVQLLHQQLLFEKHRRETHAIRNRTLFTDVTKNKVLEEHNSALTDQVKLQEADIDALKMQIDMYRKDKHCREMAALDTANYWETKYKELEKECILVKEKNEDLQNALELEKTKVQEIDSKWQNVESTLLDANAEVRIAKEQVLAGEKGRTELEHVNRELLLAGELILKYRERLSDLTLIKQYQQELSKTQEVYQHEIKGLQQQLELKITSLEASRTRISELEHNILQYDENSSVQKKILNEVKEECHEKLKAVESKYQTQLSINRSLEEKMLDMYQKIDFYWRAVHSPDTSSCHEVNATITDRTGTAPGLSPHSSPLSASLASSEGSMAFIHTDVREVKNLQVIVDQKESTVMRSSSTIDSDLSQEACSPSGQPQTSTSKTD